MNNLNLIKNKDWEKLYYLLLKTGSQESLDSYIDTVIKELDEIIPYYAANFFTYSHNLSITNNVQTVNISKRALREYEDYYYTLDDIKQKTFNQKSPIKSTDIMDYSKWQHSEYFNDFLYYNNLYYSCGIDIHYKDKLLGTIGLFREKSDPDYNNKDLNLLNVLKGHMGNQMFKLNIIEEMKLNTEDDILAKLKTGEKIYNLTDREREIVNHVMDGKNNKQLADELYISINTVKKHLNNIFRKTDVNNRTELTSLIFSL